MLTKFLFVTMFAAFVAADYEAFDDESEADPRILFANVTAGKLTLIDESQKNIGEGKS